MNVKNQLALSMKRLAEAARRASYRVSTADDKTRSRALRSMQTHLLDAMKPILEANRRDMAEASRRGLSGPMRARLELTEKKITGMAKALGEVASLPDPLAGPLEAWKRPNGLMIEKRPVPLGVILMIYESRPNVTSDAASLAIKSGNCMILKGGSEALHTNQAIHRALVVGLKAALLPAEAVQLVTSTDRSALDHLLVLNESIDLVIPRGGEGLIRAVAARSRIPVIKHYKGVCHTYIDRDADMEMAVRISENAKVQNPSVCNAMETLLVHEKAAAEFLPVFARRMKERNVELRGCAQTRKIIPGIKAATEADWSAEYLDLILAVRVVKDLDQAIEHIRRYGSQHSDAIVSRNAKAIEMFTKNLDSACVFANCSTRFADGGEFGMGAEIGISTEKLHARGPMGLRELTTYKYVVFGRGQIRG